MGRRLFGTAFITASAVGFGLLSPASPVSLDVERRRVEAGVPGVVRLGAAVLAFTPPQAAELSITRRRGWPWGRTSLGDVYELDVSPDLVSASHPARVTLPLPAPGTPGAVTLVSFRSPADGWVAYPGKVDPDGRTATASVPHLSRWAAVDIGDLLGSLGKAILRGLDLRAEQPPCKTATGVRSVNRHDDPLAWVCVSAARGKARKVVITSNRGFPLLLRVHGAMKVVRYPAGGGVVEQLAKPLYRRGQVLLIPPGGDAELAWDGTRDADVRVGSEAATVFVRTVLALAATAPVAVADAITATVSAIDCLLTAPGGFKQSWQSCAGATSTAAERLPLRHAGIRIGAKALNRLVSMLGLTGVIDLLIEKLLLHRDPFLLHLKPLKPPKKPTATTPPGRRGGGAGGAGGSTSRPTGSSRPRATSDVVIYGCH